jgi:hypothetical protein
VLHFSGFGHDIFVDAAVQHGESSRAGREFLLVLPCDWRFLPKLGPLRLRRAGRFSYTRIRPPCHVALLVSKELLHVFSMRKSFFYLGFVSVAVQHFGPRLARPGAGG